MADNSWMKDYLEKMDGKLDKLNDRFDTLDNRVNSVDVTLAKQSVILEDHTRRSLANEEAVELLKNELQPIQKERYMIKGALVLTMKIGGVVGAVIASIGVLLGIVKYFFHT